jgi:hypothetical protein
MKSVWSGCCRLCGDISDPDCDYQMCRSDCCGQNHTFCVPSKKPRTMLGVADLLLPGIKVWHLDTRRVERGSPDVHIQLDLEMRLWTESQLQRLLDYVDKCFTGVIFDVDEASAHVGDKTSSQCARLVVLLERSVPATWQEEQHAEEAEEELEVYDEIGEEGQNVHQLAEPFRMNVLFMKAALKGFLARVVSHLEGREVSKKDIETAVKKL